MKGRNPLPIKTRNVPRFVIPTGAQAEWRNPIRCKKELPQDKTCHSGRFLGSLRFARNDIIGGWFRFVRTGYIRHAAERHIGRSLHTLTDGSKCTTLVAPIIVHCPLSILIPAHNCQLSTVNCQLSRRLHSFPPDLPGLNGGGDPPSWKFPSIFASEIFIKRYYFLHRMYTSAMLFGNSRKSLNLN